MTAHRKYVESRFPDADVVPVYGANNQIIHYQVYEDLDVNAHEAQMIGIGGRTEENAWRAAAKELGFKR
jgi:hypothetical protein